MKWFWPMFLAIQGEICMAAWAGSRSPVYEVLGFALLALSGGTMAGLVINEVRDRKDKT